MAVCLLKSVDSLDPDKFDLGTIDAAFSCCGAAVASLETVSNRRHCATLRKPGTVNGGALAAAAPCGMRWLTIPL